MGLHDVHDGVVRVLLGPIALELEHDLQRRDRLRARLDHPLHRVVVRELTDVAAAVLHDVHFVAVVDCLYARKGDTHFGPESREHDLLPTGRLDRGHEVLVVPSVHGRPLDGRLFRKHRADLRPQIPTEALRLDRCEDDRHIEHPGGLSKGDGVVDDRLAIDTRDTEHHLGLVIDECDDAIVRSQ